MFKQKIKLSLIEDYIYLLKIEKYLIKCENFKNLKYYDTNEKLKNSYESLFLKYGLLDVSFLVLKKEVSSIDGSLGFNLKDVEYLQNKIINGLFEKFKKLKLNDIEINFLTKK